MVIQEYIISNDLYLIWSFMVDFENKANPFEERREAIQDWKNRAHEVVKASESVRNRAKTIEDKYAIRPKDALHIASAIEGKCDFFITTDKKLYKRLKSYEEVNVQNPFDFLAILEEL